VEAAELYRPPSLPGALEIESAQTGEDVDADGGNAKLDDDIGFLEISRTEILERGAELDEHLPDPICIVWSGADPEVKISGGPGAAVDREGMGTHEEMVSARVG
jgi:hypothetical protein